MGCGLCSFHRGRYQTNDELAESHIQTKQDGDRVEQLGCLHYRDSNNPLLHNLYCGQLLVPRGVGLELLPTFRLHCRYERSNLLFLSLSSPRLAITYIPNSHSGNRESHLGNLHFRRH